MARFDRQRRRRRRAARPLLEGLEGRIVCSADGSLNVVATNPAPGQVFTASPTTLVLTFDTPIDPNSLTDDIEVDAIDDQGGLTPLSVSIQESLDETGTELIATLPAGALAPGHYALNLSFLTLLAGVDGSIPFSGSEPLSDFYVAAPVAGPTLSGATDLGVPNSTPLSVVGSLDLSTSPGLANLYKITLPAGSNWRLGVEVDAQRIGSQLDSALALLDDQGRVIATAEHGLSDAPGDPFLFQGLAPGTYYLGISGASDLPGQPGGYDPVAGTLGAADVSQSGGAYRLLVVADPVSAPTSLLSAHLSYADPLAPATPTGLDLLFSGAMRLDSADGQTVGPVEMGLDVVDDSGKVWPLATASLGDGGASFSFLFRDRLPAGHYVVRLDPNGLLADLAGNAPVAAGQAAGVLATFDVATPPNADDPNDLGSITANASLAGISHDVDLAPNGSVSIRLVLEFAGLYEIANATNGPLTITPVGPDGLPVTESKAGLWALQPGVYFLNLTAGDSGAHGQITFSWPFSGSSSDTLFLNGVGQGPALNLRLIAPTLPTAPTSGPTVTGSSPSLPTTTTPTAPQEPSAPATSETLVASTPASNPTTTTTTTTTTISTSSQTPPTSPILDAPTTPTPTTTSPSVPAAPPSSTLPTAPPSRPFPVPEVPSAPSEATATEPVRASGGPVSMIGGPVTERAGMVGSVGLYLTPGGGVVGWPSAVEESSVTMAQEREGPVALATAGQSLNSTECDLAPAGSSPLTQGRRAPRPSDTPSTDGAIRLAANDPAVPSADVPLTAGTTPPTWLGSLREALASLLPNRRDGRNEAGAPSDGPGAATPNSPESWVNDAVASEEQPEVEEACVGGHLGFGMVAVAVAHGVRVYRKARGSSGKLAPSAARPSGRSPIPGGPSRARRGV